MQGLSPACIPRTPGKRGTGKIKKDWTVNPVCPRCLREEARELPPQLKKGGGTSSMQRRLLQVIAAGCFRE